MKYKIVHTTKYTYERSVNQSINQCIMRPIHDESQLVHHFDLSITPDAKSYRRLDYWGNEINTFYIWNKNDSITIRGESNVEAMDMNHISIKCSPADTIVTQEFKNEFAEFLCDFSYTKINSNILENLTREIWDHCDNVFDYVNNISSYIYQEFTYRSGYMDLNTTASEFLELKEGRCQDYAHLMLALCRYRGLPARFVSGYIYRGEDSMMNENSAEHAWVEVMIPGSGWIGFDPTHHTLASKHHIRVAVGRDYNDIVSMKGVKHGENQQMNTEISVTLLEESDCEFERINSQNHVI